MLGYLIRVTVKVRVRVSIKVRFRIRIRLRSGYSDYNLATLQSVVLKFRTDV